MAVDTYDKLQATLADTVNRDDLSADVTTFSPAQIDSAIKRAIDYGTRTIQRDLMALNGGHKSMEAISNSLTTTASGETVTLPTDFLSARAFMTTGTPYRVLEFKDPNSLFQQYPNTTTGQPVAYTLIAGTAYLRPIPDGVYTLRLIYNQTIPALTSSNTSNWILASHPDLYVAAGMLELAIYLENETSAAIWKARYDEHLNRLMGNDKASRWATVPVKPSLQVAIA